MTPGEWAALGLSVRVALWVVLAVVAPGVAAGWLLSRREFAGKPLVDALLHAPLVVPPVATGYLLLLLLGRRGLFGQVLAPLGVEVAFTELAAVLAAAVVAFPLVVRSVRLAIDLVDKRLEEAAATLGATPWRTFTTVTLPLALPGILSGLVLAFARSLGEFGATIIFAGNVEGQSRTLSVALWTALQAPGGEEPALRLLAISFTVGLAAMVAAEMLARRLPGKAK